MRISRAAWNDWTRRKHMSGNDMMAEMATRWGAWLTRATLAGGTGLKGGQVWCLEFDLNHPDLADYLDFGDTAHANAPVPAKGAGKARGTGGGRPTV